ncbi:MAG: fumarate/nitrate reduction transcriptional regulator Fnr [Aestuariibacter sp.]
MTQANYSLHCQNCSFSQLCLPFNLSDSELNRLDDIIKRKQPYHKGENLFELHAPLKALYAIRSGSFKSYTLNTEGDEQIIAFHLPGEIIGFDSVAHELHQSVAQALETSMVCEIPFDVMDTLSSEVPALRRQVMRLMSEEIKQDQQMFMLLNQRTAEERMAYFLMSMSSRFKNRGFASHEFRLTMTRAEIGNYLGLTVETISRLLTKFQKENLIDVKGKLITLNDLDTLSRRSKTLMPSCL